MVSVFKRAWKDTLHGQIVALFIFMAGGGLSLVFLYIWSGREVALGEIAYVLAAFFGAIGALALLFLWNLVCAPYRMERDAHAATATELEQLKLHKQRASRRRLNGEQTGLLASAIRRTGVSPSTCNVIYFSNDESADFADNIGDAIKQAGIECQVFTGGFFDQDPKDRGVKVYHSAEKTVTSFAEGVRNGLREFGFDCELRRTNDPANVFVYVARSVET